MRIRDATAADLAHIVAIYNAAIPGRFSTADTEPIPAASRVAWMNDHDPRRHPLWVAEDESPAAAGAPTAASGAPSPGNPLAGWLSFQPFYGRPAYHATAELSVYVAPGRQRSGVGQTLLARAVDEAPRLGLATLLGFVFGHNEASLALFGRFGFGRWGHLPRVAELDGIERDLVIVGLRVAR